MRNFRIYLICDQKVTHFLFSDYYVRCVAKMAKSIVLGEDDFSD